MSTLLPKLLIFFIIRIVFTIIQKKIKIIYFIKLYIRCVNVIIPLSKAQSFTKKLP